LAAIGSLHPLVSGGTCVPDQDASFRASRLGVAGPIFGDGLETLSSSGHTPPPPERRGEPPRRPSLVRQATFMRAPSGSSPVVTYFHKATRSFLARATAAILRTRPLVVPTRSMNQRAKALSGW
jgi:hypothetical protein